MFMKRIAISSLLFGTDRTDVREQIVGAGGLAAAVAVMPPPIPSLSNAMADTEFLANWPGSSKEPHDGARARKRWKYAYARVRALNIFKQQGVGVLSSRVQKGGSIAERIARLEARNTRNLAPSCHRIRLMLASSPPG